jgi:hypothetical protein
MRSMVEGAPRPQSVRRTRSTRPVRARGSPPSFPRRIYLIRFPAQITRPTTSTSSAAQSGQLG